MGKAGKQHLLDVCGQVLGFPLKCVSEREWLRTESIFQGFLLDENFRKVLHLCEVVQWDRPIEVKAIKKAKFDGIDLDHPD